MGEKDLKTLEARRKQDEREGNRKLDAMKGKVEAFTLRSVAEMLGKSASGRMRCALQMKLRASGVHVPVVALADKFANETSSSNAPTWK
jgi:hypothetical protein